MSDNEVTIIAENLPMVPQMETVRQIDAFRMEFTNFLREKMIEGIDYGVIPGTGQKPTLLKPGAEKLLNYFGFSSALEVEEKMEDHHEGYFFYKYRATISDSNGRKLSDGYGSANTKENKYAKQNPWTMANTVDKMAQKRAMVSATLASTRASEFYTQDVEDMNLAPTQPAAARAAQPRPQQPAATHGITVFVDTIEEKTSSKGQPYRIIHGDGQKYFVWDKKLQFSEGESYRIDLETKGNFTSVIEAVQLDGGDMPTNDEPF